MSPKNRKKVQKKTKVNQLILPHTHTQNMATKNISVDERNKVSDRTVHCAETDKVKIWH